MADVVLVQRHEAMKNAFKVIRAVKPVMRRYHWSIAAMILLGILEAAAEGVGISLFIPLLSGELHGGRLGLEPDNWLSRVLHLVFGTGSVSDRLLGISLCILGLVVFKNALAYANAILFDWLEFRLSHALRLHVFDQLLHVGMRFIERHESGQLLNTLESQTGEVSEAVSTLVALVINICTILVLLALLLVIDWRLTLLATVALLLISVIIQLVTRRVETLARAGVRADEALSQRMLQVFSGMRTIRLFGRESYERESFAKASHRMGRSWLRVSAMSDVIEPVFEILVVALLLVVLFTTLQTSRSLPTVLVFIVILYRMYPNFSDLNENRNALVAATASVDAVEQLLDSSNKPYIRSGSVPCTGFQEAIRFEAVSFRYDVAEPLALHDVSIRILQGKTTALVGPSGAGKSTLISLIVRLYDPSEGSLVVDDVPLQQLDLASWRRRIAVVNQDIHVFNTTVRANIAYGRLHATDDEIITAARQADAHDFISALPQGYDTRLGDQGVRLSAGQKQRITLARAIVRDPEILILDEATNALDSLSEHVIQASLKQFGHNRTVIVIAHRLSTIEQADHIIVLDAGRVVEQGSVAQLLDNEALFARLKALQNRGFMPHEEMT